MESAFMADLVNETMQKFAVAVKDLSLATNWWLVLHVKASYGCFVG